MIKLSYNSTLYSYDGNTETAITNASELGIEIHSQTDLSSSQLVYEQESMGAQSVPIVNNQATIQGINLKSGPLTLYLQIGGKLSNGFIVHITKLATPSGLMDDDPVFTVDRDRRIITIPDTQAIMAVVRDTNSEIIKFKFPRYADGVDLSTKTAYVNFVNATGAAYKSLLSTPQADDGYVFVEWVVGETVTTQEGVVLFQVEFYGTNYRWQTQIAQLKVVKSLEAQAAEPLQDQTLLEEYLDRFNHLIADGVTPSIGDNGNWYIGSTDTGKPSRGAPGAKGDKGDKGDTPVKGTDYWTASDKAEVVAEAAAAIDLTSYAKKTEVPTKTSQLTNDSGFLTSHQDISGKQDKSTLEADVAAKGFTKNTGTYSKPTGGIPKADLVNDVQVSLGKADTALQEHQSLAAYRTAAAQDEIDSDKVDKVDGKGLSTNDYTAAAKAKVDAIPANPKYTDTVYDDAALKERIATIEGKESAWDAKSDFSGSYNDLTDKPTPLTGTTGNLTPTQVYDAVSAGIPVKVQYFDDTYGFLSFTAFNVAESLNVIVSQTIVYYNSLYILAELFGNKSNNIWGFNTTTLAQKTDIPEALPNPNALTFTGAVNATYDGSAAVSVKIPSAVTDDHINSLIDTKLGVIENGSY